MGKVREYTGETTVSRQSAQVAVPGRRATGEDFGGGPGLRQVGRTLREAVGTELADAGRLAADAQGRQEVTTVHTRMAEFHAKWTTELQRRAQIADPADTKFAESFNNDVQQDLDRLGLDINTAPGKDAFDRAYATTKGSFIVDAAHHQAVLTGVNARQLYERRVDAEGNILLTDPAKFEQRLIETTRDLESTAGQYAAIPAKDREVFLRKTREQLALSAVQGEIRHSPQLALDRLNSGVWDEYLDAGKKSVLLGNADTALRANRLQTEHERTLAERQRKDLARAIESGLVTKLALNRADPKKNPALSATDIATSGLIEEDNDAALRLLAIVETRDKELRDDKPIHSNTGVLTDTFRRIHLDWGDPKKITDTKLVDSLYIAKKLSTDDYHFLRTEVEQARDPNGQSLGTRTRKFIEDMAPQLDKSVLGRIDTMGKQRVDEFLQYTMRRVSDMKKEGKNPYDLFDVTKPEYLGRQDVIKSFQTTLQRQMRDAAARANGQPGTGRAGESSPRGVIEPGNIDLSKRKVVANADGSFSTVVSKSFNIGGRTVLLPSLDPDGKAMTDEQTVERYKRTGEHMGIFQDEASATAYAKGASRKQALLRRPNESPADYLKRTKGE